MGGLNAWNGSAYVPAEPRLWTGSGYVAPSGVYRWDQVGAAFVKVWPTGAFPLTFPFTFGGGTTVEPEHPYLSDAAWLWEPIPANPVLDSNSATWAGYLASGSHSAALYEYAAVVILPDEVTSSTPRHTIPMSNVPAWGPHPFGSETVPIPAGTIPPPMETEWGDPGDAHVVVADPINGKVYGLWQARLNGGVWSASFGGTAELQGDGRDLTGSSTGSGLSRLAGVIRIDELVAAAAANTGLGHTLFISSDCAGPGVRYPAVKSDGENWRGVANPIPEGARFQLDPSINVNAISGITAGEKVIAKTLQTHGAVVGDQGGASAAFIFEMSSGGSFSSPGPEYAALGFGWDYFELSHIPWSGLRFLSNWDGGI